MDAKIKATAKAYAEACAAEQVELLRTLGRIPAPSGQEDLRAAFCRDWFLAQGAKDVEIDGAKNVICRLGPQDGELLVFAAHTDVVFPDTEPLPLREENGILYAPGIGDDTANLVNLMLAARYLLQNGLPRRVGLLIVANACEEGLGNLAGTKALFREYVARIRGFCSFDCDMPQCVNAAVGSYRYRITCRTRGGHSYGDFGRPNAIEILCDLVERLYRIELPTEARTTCNVGILYEFRSASQGCLELMEARFRETIAGCRDRGGELTVETVGVRPGSGPVDPEALTALTERTADVIRSFSGEEPRICAASTDANVPLSLGIPAVTVGTVRGGLAHTREEWVALDSLPAGLEIALSLMLQETQLSDR